MSGTNKKAEGSARDGVPDAAQDDENEIRAEEDSAKAMDADVPHPTESDGADEDRAA
jgi:hypothetical protein